MVETAHESMADEPGHPNKSPARASFEELATEPDRVADAADFGPVRIGRPGHGDLVLLSAAEFDRLTHPGRTRSMLITELTDTDIERMHAQPMPVEAAAFDHEGGFPAHD